MNLMRSRFTVVKKKKNFITRKQAYQFLEQCEMKPEALESLKAKVRTDPGFKYALFRNKDKAFDDVIIYNTSNIQNLFIMIVGFPGTGKTTTGKSIALQLTEERKKNRKIKGKVLLAYTYKQLTKLFKDANRGDVLFKDENTKAAGYRSNMEQAAVVNYMSVIRDQEICAVLVSPRDYTKNEFGLANMYLMPLGFNPKTKENRCLWMDKEGNYIGIINVPFKTDKKLTNEMEKRKLELQERLKNNCGYIYTGIDEEDIKEDEKTFYEYIKEYPLSRISKRSILLTFPFVPIRGDDFYLEVLANKIFQKLDAEKKKDEQESKLEQKSELSNISIGQYNTKIEQTDEYFDELFYNRVIHELKKYELSDLDIRIFEALLDNEPYRRIESRLGVPKANITRLKNKITENFLGYAGEDAYESDLKINSYDFDHGGQNSSDPDFIIHSLKEVHSFKTYMFENDTKAIHKIAKSELEYAEKNDYKLKLMIFYMYNKTFKIFDVSFQGATGQKNREKTPPLPQVEVRDKVMFAVENGAWRAAIRRLVQGRIDHFSSGEHADELSKIFWEVMMEKLEELESQITEYREKYGVEEGNKKVYKLLLEDEKSKPESAQIFNLFGRGA